MSQAYKPTKKGESEHVVDRSHYVGMEYDTKLRFISYWHQINEVYHLGLHPVLEIGIGNGFVSNYLKQLGAHVSTLDIDPNLGPDVAGSVLDIPFSNSAFKVVSCYEVLEHIPYDNFHNALSEIHRISSSHAIVSLPDATKAQRIELWIPMFGVFKRLLKLPWVELGYRSDIQHYWEIGIDGWPLKRIFRDIREVGFQVEKTFRLFEHPYHRFFRLRKSTK